MYHKAIRTVAVTSAAAATIVAGLAGTTAAAADQKAPLGGGNQAMEQGSPLEAAAKAYRTAYPRMSQAQAENAARQQETRKALQGRITAGGRAATFAGGWYDAPNDTVHIAATTDAARAFAATSGRRLGLKVTTHAATRSFAQLEAAADTLRKSRTGLGKVAAGHVGIDVRTNSVVAAVPKSQLTSLRRQSAGVRLIAKPASRVEADYGCTSRSACDYTIRAGSMLWRGAAGNNVCSVGFTGRQTNNQRWVYTAGHCSNGNGVTWGTGSAYIGPMYAAVDSGSYDAAIIRVTNPWFAYDQGGEIYHSVYVNGVAPTLSYIWAGDSVCLSANYTNPTGGNFCGVVGTNSDPAVRGMVRVNGLDACGGDSGGGWYWLTSAGKRIAYGLHSRSDTGCHGSAGGSRSWFSPLPTIKAGWTPWLNVETRP
jgi:streptogrisin C